jgi:hypothetical protein
MDKKCLFVIQPQSMIDVITNSSSELFIFQGQEKEMIEELLTEVYPNYLNEYDHLVNVRDCSNDHLNSLLYWIAGSYCWPAVKSDYSIPGNFEFDELYEPDGEGPAWNGSLQYRLKRNYQGENKYDYAFVTEDNFNWVLDKLDPYHNMYLLYSINENPNWEMQEKLELIGERYHLG